MWLIVAAALVGVSQLHVLGSGTRSISFRVLVAAVTAGAYGAGALSLLAEVGATRLTVALAGGRLGEVIDTAGYTVDPFIEELAKVAPLVVAGVVLRGRHQWGVTDHVLLGAASGAGFGVLEVVARFGSSSMGAIGGRSGWLLPTSLSPPFVPSVPTSLRSWLPAPITQEPLNFPDGPDVFKHLVWSAVAGLAVGLWRRAPGGWRWVAPLLVAAVAADHAASNYRAASSGVAGGTVLGDALSWPFHAMGPLLGLWPVLALVVAVVLDRRAVRRLLDRTPALRMVPAERGRRVDVVCLAGYSVMWPPWTALVVQRYVLVRRAAAYGASDDGDGLEVDEAVQQVVEVRGHLARAASREAWRGVRPVRGWWAGIRSAAASSPLRFVLATVVPLLLWMVLAAPVLVFYLAGSQGRRRGPQLAFYEGWGFPVARVLLFVGLAWTAWRVQRMIRAFRSARQLPLVERSTRLWFALWASVGTSALGVVVARVAVAGGADGDDRVLAAYHLLDSWGALLLAAGIILILAAVVLSPAVAPLLGLGFTLYTSESVLFATLGAGLVGYSLDSASQRGRAGVGTGTVPHLGPGPRLPFDPGPLTPLLVALVGVSGQFLGGDSADDGPARAEPLDPHQYRDAEGDLRWRDTNQLVTDNPNRSRYQDDDGIWRWSDTDEPVGDVQPGPGPAARPHVRQRQPNWCGAAAGEMVARDLGADVSQEQLADHPGFRPEERSADGVAYQAGGFEVRELIDAMNDLAPVPGRYWTGGDLPQLHTGGNPVTADELRQTMAGYLGSSGKSLILRVDRGNHWVVVDEVLPDGTIAIRDPAATGPQVVTAEELAAMNPTGDAVLSFPGP